MGFLHFLEQRLVRVERGEDSIWFLCKDILFHSQPHLVRVCCWTSGPAPSANTWQGMTQCPVRQEPSCKEQVESLDPKPTAIYSVLYLSLIKQQREGSSVHKADDDGSSIAAAGSHSRDCHRLPDLGQGGWRSGVAGGEVGKHS